MLLLLGLLPHLLAAGAARVSLPSQTAAPGTSVILPLVLESGNATISGVQFDVQYDNSAMGLTAIPGDAVKNSGKVLYEADLAPNRRRFLVVGLNPNQIANGTLINLFVNLNTSAPPGVFPLSFSNAAGTDPYGVFASVIGSDGSVIVQGTIDQSVPLQTAGVLNGASVVFGPLAPGEVFILVGSNIAPSASTGPVGSQSSFTLGETRVLFDGIPASLSYAATNQISGVTPFELAGHMSTNIRVANGDRVISDLAIPVAPTSPAIFTLDASGVGPGAILNQDSSVNSPSNPAGKGTIVALFGTGAGQTDPPGVDGQITGAVSTPILPVSLQIGGLDAEVLYAGTAPGLVAGVLQVNVRIPLAAASGFSVPVVLTVGQTSGPAGVTLAVQ